MGKDAQRPRTYRLSSSSRRVVLRCSRLLPTRFGRVKRHANDALCRRAPHEEPFATLHTLQPSISERKTHR